MSMLVQKTVKAEKFLEKKHHSLSFAVGMIAGALAPAKNLDDLEKLSKFVKKIANKFVIKDDVDVDYALHLKYEDLLIVYQDLLTKKPNFGLLGSNYQDIKVKIDFSENLIHKKDLDTGREGVTIIIEATILNLKLEALELNSDAI